MSRKTMEETQIGIENSWRLSQELRKRMEDLDRRLQQSKYNRMFQLQPPDSIWTLSQPTMTRDLPVSSTFPSSPLWQRQSNQQEIVLPTTSSAPPLTVWPHIAPVTDEITHGESDRKPSVVAENMEEFAPRPQILQLSNFQEYRKRLEHIAAENRRIYQFASSPESTVKQPSSVASVAIQAEIFSSQSNSTTSTSRQTSDSPSQHSVAVQVGNVDKQNVQRAPRPFRRTSSQHQQRVEVELVEISRKPPVPRLNRRTVKNVPSTTLEQNQPDMSEEKKLQLEERRRLGREYMKRRQMERRSSSNPPPPAKCHEFNRSFDPEAIRKFVESREKDRREKEAEERRKAADEALKRQEQLRLAERHQAERSKKSVAQLILEDKFGQGGSLNIERVQSYIRQTEKQIRPEEGQCNSQNSFVSEDTPKQCKNGRESHSLTSPTGTSSLSSQSPRHQSPPIGHSSPVKVVEVDQYNIANSIRRKYPQFSGFSQLDSMRAASEEPVEMKEIGGDNERSPSEIHSDSFPLDTSISSHFESSAPLTLSISRKGLLPQENETSVVLSNSLADMVDFETPKRSTRPPEGLVMSGRPDVVPETASNGKSPTDSGSSGSKDLLLQPSALEDRIHAGLDFLASTETNLRRTENLKQHIATPIAVQRTTDESINSQIQATQQKLIEAIATSTFFLNVDKSPPKIDIATVTDPVFVNSTEKSIEAKMSSEKSSPAKRSEKSSSTSARLSSDTSASLPVQLESESSESSSLPKSWASEKKEFGTKLTVEARKMVGGPSAHDKESRKEAVKLHIFWFRRYISAQIAILHMQKRRVKLSKEDMKTLEEREEQLGALYNTKKEELRKNINSPIPESEFLQREKGAVAMYHELTNRALQKLDKLKESSSSSSQNIISKTPSVSTAIDSSNNGETSVEVPEELEEAKNSHAESVASEVPSVTAQSDSTTSTVKEISTARSSSVPTEKSSETSSSSTMNGTSSTTKISAQTDSSSKRSASLRRKSFGREETPNLSFSSDASEMEARLTQLRQQLNEKRDVAEKLKVEYRQRNRDRLLDSERSVKKQIEIYDRFIQRTEQRIASIESGLETVRPATPPVIMSPRNSPRDRTSLEPSRPVSPHKSILYSPRLTLVKAADILKKKSSDEASFETATQSSSKGKATSSKSSSQPTSDNSESEKQSSVVNQTKSIEKVLTASVSIKTTTNTSIVEDLPGEILVAVMDQSPEAESISMDSHKRTEKDSEPTEMIEDDITLEKLDTHRSMVESMSESKGSWHPDETSTVSKVSEESTGEEKSSKSTNQSKTSEITEQQQVDISEIVETLCDEVTVETITLCIKEWLVKLAEANVAKDNGIKSKKDSMPTRASWESNFVDSWTNELTEESVDQVLSDTKDRRRQDVEQAEVVDLSNSQHRERELHRVLELARKSLGSDYLNRSDSIRSDDEGTTTPNSSPRISLTSPRSPTDKFLTVYKSPRKSPKRRQSIDEDLEVVELSHGDLEEEISQEWLDDDFGLGANKISEPITSHVAQRLSPRSPRITTDMFSAVPHKPEQIREITDAAVELLVTQRRCGEPLSSIKCPDESTSTYPYGELPLSRESDRVYREFLFDYTRDILSSIFPDEEVELPLRSWEKPPRLQRSAVLRIAPQSLDDLKKRVYDEIICSRRRPPLKSRRVTAGSRKPDEVDQLLTEEMYEEEQHWADYTAEEMAVKFRTADSIFQVLWNETLELVSQLTSD